MDANQDPIIYKAYKPLRNAIRKLELADSLGVIRAYMTNLQFNQNIPPDCQVHPDYYAKGAAWVSEFHLETICREVVLHAREFGRAEDTLKDWKILARTVNRLKKLEELIAARYRSSDFLMQELHRMAHRQFPWQAFRPNAVNITRYHMIYGHPPLAGIIKMATGLSPEELFLFGMALLGVFLNSFAQTYPAAIQIPGLSPEGLDRFLGHFSRNLPELKGLLQTEHQMNERFAYAYHSLRAFPLIRMKFQGKDHLVCPIPTLLFWRFIGGIYYEIFSQPGFENAFGEAFQWYVGQVLENGTTREKTRIYPECEYRVGRDTKRTVDWIVDQGNAALFVEAKTKRLRFEARVEIVQQDILSKELDKLAAMIVQVYKSIRDYRDGKYPNYAFDPQRKIYPMVVTLEDWFLMGPKMVNEVKGDVSRRMEKEEIPLEYLKDMPFSVCSTHEFEQAVQVMDQVGIVTVMQGKVVDSRQEWTLSAFLRDGFREYARNSRFLFQKEFDAIGVKTIGEWN
jgi:hypothetical protein